MTGVPSASTAYAAPFAVRFGLILAIAALTASWYSFNRVATEGGIPYLGVVFWQCFGSAAILGVALLIRRRRVPLSRRHLVFYAVSGFLGAVFPFIGVALAASRVPLGVLSLGLALEPAITYLIALPLLLERFRTIRFAGILLGIAGLMLILVPEAALPSRAMVPWVLVAMALPFGQALWNNYAGIAWPPEVGSHVLAFGLVTAAAFMLLVPAIATGAIWWFDGPGPNPDLWWPLVALAMTNCGWIARVRNDPACGAGVLLDVRPDRHAADRRGRHGRLWRTPFVVDLERADPAAGQPLPGQPDQGRRPAPDRNAVSQSPPGSPGAYTAPLSIRLGLIIAMAGLTAVWYLLMRGRDRRRHPYLGVAFWQCAGASAIAGPVILLRRKQLPLSRRHLVFYAISGLFGAVVPLW